MTLPSSGNISLNSIKTEFGGGASVPINSYYAGGTYVPTGTTGINGAIPSSGQINLAIFYGASAIIVNSFTLNQGYVYNDGGKTNPTYSRGYSNSSYVSYYGSFGSITPLTFTTGGSTKTIEGFTGSYPASNTYLANTSNTAALYFTLAGNVPNDANAFTYIQSNGNKLYRTASAYVPYVNSSVGSNFSQWVWSTSDGSMSNTAPLFLESANNTNITVYVS